MKTTSLKLLKNQDDNFLYYASPILEGNRKIGSITGFLKENYDFLFTEYKRLPTVIMKDKLSSKGYRMIDFYKRVNNQFFGRSFASGKCIYGIFSHPWHKKNKVAELTLFESTVNFEDLYQFDFQEGKYVPEFSTKRNWMQTYTAVDSKNVTKALHYVKQQSESTGIKRWIELKEAGLIAD